MHVNEAIAVELARRGVACTFSLPSNETIHMLVEAEKRGITLYRTRHEHGAVGMADGYARTSGKVGVALVGKGPGLTNGINPLITAAKAKSRVLLITGDRFTSPDTDPRVSAGFSVGKKDIDQVALLRAVGVVPAVLSSADTAAADFAAAFDLAESGMVVAVLVPEDVGQTEAGTGARQIDLPPPRATMPTQPGVDEIQMVADVLAESWAASRPVILAGAGAVRSGARDSLIELAASIGAVLATTLLGKGLFDGDPFNIGVVGTMASPLATSLVSRSDLLLVFGASLGPFTTLGGDLFRQSRVIRIDSDATVLGPRSADVSIAADAGLSAAALVAELARRGHQHSGYRAPELAAQLAIERAQAPADPGPEGGVDPEVLIYEINRRLPEPRVVVVDTAAHAAYSARYLHGTGPGTMLMPSEFSSVGAGLPFAFGAAIARPERATVLALGDGAFMMTLSDFDTAVRYALPIITLVMNNGGFAAEYQKLHLENLADDLSLYANPSLAGVARSLGADALTITTLSDLDLLQERLARLRGPLVIDCRVPIDAAAEWAGVSRRMHTTATQPAM